MKAIRPAIGPALDDPPTAPKPVSLDTLAAAIVRARNLRVQAECMVEKVISTIEQTMAALEHQKQEAEGGLGEARRIELEEIARFVSECKELGVKAEDIAS